MALAVRARDAFRLCGFNAEWRPAGNVDTVGLLNQFAVFEPPDSDDDSCF